MVNDLQIRMTNVRGFYSFHEKCTCPSEMQAAIKHIQTKLLPVTVQSDSGQASRFLESVHKLTISNLWGFSYSLPWNKNSSDAETVGTST